ncbi:OmpW family outer membrane protein [Sphingomonas immobilis]|uniref:OmpW family outer membrane protein n=1 Tax=Sphingomonas immobilis TaxID=3063997 RepID=A0ABT9A1H6_9SPHN|nr:OmpW family outer membrane protein [Sphingomonas sp. CA1-15]MDO7843669.1 OmpW family outer membrane protein [Sphingomonas sp. CA1-15]
MTMKYAFATLLGTTAMFAAAPAFAQEAGDVNVSVSASRTKLVDKGEVYTNGVYSPDDGYKTRSTYHGTVDVVYFPIDSFALEASVSTPGTTDNTPAGALAGLPNLGDDEFTMVTLGGRVQPFRGLVSPYVGAGYQFHFTTQTRDGLGVGLTIPDTGGAYVKGGVQLNVAKRWGVFAEVRKAWYATHASGKLPLDATYTSFAQIDANAVLDPLTVSIGMTAKFGPSAGGDSADGGPITTDETRWTIRAGVTELTLADKVALNVGGAPYAGAGLSTYEHHTPTVQIGYFFTPHIAFNATLGFPPTIPIHGGGSIGALPTLGEITYGPTAFTLQYHLTRSGRIRPYVGAGASYMIVFGTKDGAFQNLRVDNNLGVALEAGSDLMITNKLALFADVKKAFLRPKAYGTFQGQAVVGQTRLDPWAFSGGVAIHF